MRNPLRVLPVHWLLVAGVAVAMAVPGAVVVTTTATTTAAHTSSSTPDGTTAAQASVGHIGAPTIVHPQVSAQPYQPTQAQLAARADAMAGLAKHVAPSMGQHTTLADVQGSGGPETGTSAQAAGTFTQLRKSLINSTCSGCGQSSINEPSVANNGKFIVETSNWNIAYSTTGGVGTTPWLNQNPYAFSSGFCCDQMVTYVPSRNIFLLLQLDYAGEGNANNGLALSVASGKTPTSWCTYKFSGAIGGGATSTPDFPKIAVANNNAYLTWNEYPPNAGFARSGLARMPLDSLAACAGFSYSFLTRTTEFTFALSQAPSSLNTFYWVSNWFLDGTTNGSNMRIFTWAENSGTYFANTRAINAYTFGNASCGSPNWCSRLDPRWESVVITNAQYRAQANSAFAGDSILEVATSAGPSGFSNGKNYVVYNYFKLNSLTYIGNDQTYSTSTNFAYPGCAVNAAGYVGCAMADGTNVPGGLILLQDDVNPTQPWGFSFNVPGVSGATGWGDYVVTSPWNPGVGPFQTVLWQMNGSTVQPYYIVWGRGKDLNGFNRWKNS